MAFRLTTRERTDATVVRIEGTLDKGATACLMTEVRGVPGERLVIDLAGIAVLDEAGRAALRDLVDRGARIERASPFVALQLTPDDRESQVRLLAPDHRTAAPPLIKETEE